MLSAHPSISISSEGAYIYHVRSKLYSYGDLSDSTNLEALHRDILPFLHDEKWLSPPAFEELLGWARKYGTGLRSIMTFYGTWEAQVVGKKELIWWGDNAPYHVHSVPYFHSLFPECKFILMIRDPRDVYTSIKFNYKDPYPLSDVMGLWEKALLDGLLAELFLGCSRVKKVRYEDLVTRPTSQLREICEFLGVEYKEEMLSYYQSDPARALSQIKHHANVVEPVFPSSVGKYHQMLTKEEIHLINQRLSSPLKCLGYLSEDESKEGHVKQSVEIVEGDAPFSSR